MIEFGDAAKPGRESPDDWAPADARARFGADVASIRERLHAIGAADGDARAHEADLRTSIARLGHDAVRLFAAAQEGDAAAAPARSRERGTESNDDNKGRQ